ncbi:2-amino-4-hydroxy-6-hydroxymethyldihydropteridine pyrophosphokinase [Candidatus Entotheonellaceae bacterium PAL068K]
MAVVYLGLGSNLGDRRCYLQRACATLHCHPAVTVQAVSSLYHTAPVGVTDQAWFLNAVTRLHTTLSPPVLLRVTQATERRLGRVPTRRWGPRCIDLDILLYDHLALCTPSLTIPHAALHERAFVLVPLHELAPDLQIPSGRAVHDLLSTLSTDGIEPLGPFPPYDEGIPP